MTTIRKSVPDDMPVLLRFAAQGSAYFRSKGIPQWINGYPGEKEFGADIANGWSHIIEQDGEPIGCFAVSFDGEPTYDTIEGGRWRCDKSYAVIHRCAVDNSQKGRGIAAIVFATVEGFCRERGISVIRCDTHELNASMRRAMEKFGFVYCGVIHLESGAPRVAYDYIIGESAD